MSLRFATPFTAGGRISFIASACRNSHSSRRCFRSEAGEGSSLSPRYRGGISTPTKCRWIPRPAAAQSVRPSCGQSNRVPYAVDSLPECNEIEDDGNTEDAQHIALPQIINGRIGKPGDVDIFRFDANAGDEIVAEVYARRLNSPLDSLLWLSDANGKTLAYNDDNGDKNVGLLTHNADSYLRLRLPEKGTYFVHLADSQNHGGQDYGYRLRISPPQPDFALLAAPSSINILAGGTVPITVEVLRKDGFNGEIEVTLKDAPPGFKLSGAKIPAGCDRLRITLTAPQKPLEQPINLQLEGRAKIDGQTVSRPVIPAEDMMQAFIYRHMVPSQELMVATGFNKRRAPMLELVDNSGIKIPAGGTAKVRVKMPKRPAAHAPAIYLELSEPPAGLTLRDVNITGGEMTFAIAADSNTAKVGLADNLIVDVSADPPNNPKQDKQKKDKNSGFISARCRPYHLRLHLKKTEAVNEMSLFSQ